MSGPVVGDYAVLPHRGDWQTAELYGPADELLVPLIAERVPPTSSAELAPAGRTLRVEGAVVSAVTRTGDALTIRAFNPAAMSTSLAVEIDGEQAHGTIVDLRDQPVGAFSGQRDLRAGEIVTLRLH